MVNTKKKFSAKWFIIGIGVIVSLFAFYHLGQSLVNYKFIGSRNMAPIGKDIQIMIRDRIKTAAAENKWAENSLQSVNITEILDLTNDMVADRLEYEYTVACFDPNAA